MGDNPKTSLEEEILNLFSDSDMFEARHLPDVAISHWPKVIYTTATPMTFPGEGGWFKKLYDQATDTVFIPMEMSPAKWDKIWADIRIKESIQLLFESPNCAGYAQPSIERKEGPRTIVVLKERENMRGMDFSFSVIDDPVEFKDWGPKDPRFNGREMLRRIIDLVEPERPTMISLPGEYKSFPQKATERPWATPNRKRFKRANRRRK